MLRSWVYAAPHIRVRQGSPCDMQGFVEKADKKPKRRNALSMPAMIKAMVAGSDLQDEWC
ncbi:hypothetical protein CO661_31820 [Sinorhizobium fredii]|uniref:Uncharacterized protein n=1 Tax=Rhizobium fredii TaxID=380 RepID=A0A2A6LN54_RHIFR|nr:hypothetical protein CO661_31820 [Sinorhizobium fredii]